jgi:hypothetical protein
MSPTEDSTLQHLLGSLHDGYLVDIRVDGTLVTLECRRTDRVAIKILIANVDDMYCTNFRSGNIILDAETLSTIDDVLESSPELVEGLCQSRSPAQIMRYVEQMRAAEREHGMTYFVLGSSYGADMIVASSGDAASSIRIEKL